MTVRYDHQRQTGALNRRVRRDQSVDRARPPPASGSSWSDTRRPPRVAGPCGSSMLKCRNPTAASAWPAVTAMSTAKTMQSCSAWEPLGEWDAKDPANGTGLRQHLFANGRMGSPAGKPPL